MAPFLPPSFDRVLEVGCAEGSFAHFLQKASEIWGVEYSAEAAAVASGRMHRVLVGSYDSVSHELPSRYFDLVVCNDVIEHLADPEAFLVSVREKMVHRGWLIASMPNMRHWRVLFDLLIRKDWRYVESGILDRTHLRFFTQRSIRRLLDDAGFSVEFIVGINGPTHISRKLFFSVISFLTVGYYRDIQFRQFAARSRLFVASEGADE